MRNRYRKHIQFIAYFVVTPSSLFKRIILIIFGVIIGYLLGKQYTRTIVSDISIESRPRDIFPYLSDFNQRPDRSAIKSSSSGFSFDTKGYPGTQQHSIRRTDTKKDIAGILQIQNLSFQKYLQIYGQQTHPYQRNYLQHMYLQKGIKTTRISIIHEEYLDANQMIFFLILGFQKKIQHELDQSLMQLKKLIEQSPREKKRKSLNYILLKRQILTDELIGN